MPMTLQKAQIIACFSRPRFDHNPRKLTTFDHIFRGLLCWLLYNGQPIMTQEFEYPTIATQQPTIATYAFSPVRGTKKVAGRNCDFFGFFFVHTISHRIIQPHHLHRRRDCLRINRPRDGSTFDLVILLAFAAIAAHPKQRAGADDIVLQPVQNQTGLPWNKGSTGDDGREIHHNVVNLIGTVECDFGLRLFEEIDVNDIGIIDPGKLPDRKSLAALADTLDD